MFVCKGGKVVIAYKYLYTYINVSRYKQAPWMHPDIYQSVSNPSFNLAKHMTCTHVIHFMSITA